MRACGQPSGPGVPGQMPQFHMSPSPPLAGGAPAAIVVVYDIFGYSEFPQASDALACRSRGPDQGSWGLRRCHACPLAERAKSRPWASCRRRFGVGCSMSPRGLVGCCHMQGCDEPGWRKRGQSTVERARKPGPRMPSGSHASCWEADWRACRAACTPQGGTICARLHFL